MQLSAVHGALVGDGFTEGRWSGKVGNRGEKKKKLTMAVVVSLLTSVWAEEQICKQVSIRGDLRHQYSAMSAYPHPSRIPPDRLILEQAYKLGITSWVNFLGLPWKGPHSGWLTFSQSGGWKSRSRCSKGESLPRPLSLTWRWWPSFWVPRGPPSVHV